MDDKKVKNFAVGYLIGQKIRNTLEAGLGLAIITCLWAVPLWIFHMLGIGHS